MILSLAYQIVLYYSHSLVQNPCDFRYLWITSGILKKDLGHSFKYNENKLELGKYNLLMNQSYFFNESNEWFTQTAGEYNRWGLMT